MDENPFDDPAVRKAVGGRGRTSFDDDPFDTESLAYPASTYSAPRDDDEVDNLVYPTSTRASAPSNAMQMEEIQRRERELEARERDLEARTDHLQRYGRNNWPPCTLTLTVYPMFYHDIAGEIPPDAQPVMTMIYYLWLVLVGTLVVNAIACIFLFTAHNIVDGLKDLIMGFIYLVLITCASFFLWYRPVYYGLMKEHSLFYYVYFLFCGFHILFSAYAFIGPPGTGCAGLVNMIDAFQKSHWAAGALSVVCTVGFAVQGLGQLWYYRIIWKHNKEKGHTFAQAKAELASHGARAYFLHGARV
ncbi:hypothetical protein MCUN1_002208 [Malassezia cuniculi]|uniref:Scamp-domain-containing protein n=1 Tax=Malassezia cuniculi TaxID=948313 RepID=A0AAF0J761_9BASI|nr:hypothetical protein MCUN1_002208 [Malassezia cuniculi]